VRHDSTKENMRLLWHYVERHGRPVAFCTDKASLFQAAPKVARNAQALPREEREPMPPTQIGRSLRELGIGWQAAHSPQAKGRVQRSFATAQDRLVKGLRVAGAKTLEQANRYLEEEFLPWWNQHLRVAPAQAADAHRPLGPEQDLAAALSRVDTRQVSNDYTFRWEGHMYQIARASVRPGLRGGTVRVEARLDGTLAVRFRDGYLAVSLCQPRPKVTPPPAPAARRRSARKPSQAMRQLVAREMARPGLPVWVAASIDRTLTTDTLDGSVMRSAGQEAPGGLLRLMGQGLSSEASPP
jgi:hypothetical protein